MKRIFIQLLTWFGILLGCTAVSVLVWMLLFAAKEDVASLKWQQFLMSFGMFVVPPFICARLWDKTKPLSRLKLNKGAHWSVFLMGMGLILLAIPAINLLADLNSRIDLPKSLDFIEQIMRQIEDKNAEHIAQFLNTDTMLLNVGLIALLPALAEELTFRGTLQQILGNRHIAIWITAFIFASIHMMFHQFIPLLLMGVLFGYVFLWTGSLWVSIVMHFTNNALVIVLYSIYGDNKYADTIGAGNTWWIGVISLVITCLGLREFYRRTRKR